APPGGMPVAPAAERRTSPATPIPAPATRATTERRAAPGALLPPAAALAGGAPPEAAPAGRAVQVLGCYLVVEVPPDELLLVDQHALHQRVLYERLLARLASGAAAAQRLLAPEVVELPPARAALLLEHREALA